MAPNRSSTTPSNALAVPPPTSSTVSSVVSASVRPLSSVLSAAPRIVSASSSGDVYLYAKGYENVIIRCSSATLSKACEFFRAMFQGGFSEGVGLDHRHPPSHAILETTPAALCAVLLVLHGITSTRPDVVNYTAGDEVRQLCNYLQCPQCIPTVAKQWTIRGRDFNATLHATEVANEIDFSIVLDHDTGFKYITGWLMHDGGLSTTAITSEPTVTDEQFMLRGRTMLLIEARRRQIREIVNTAIDDWDLPFDSSSPSNTPSLCGICYDVRDELKALEGRLEEADERRLRATCDQFPVIRQLVSRASARGRDLSTSEALSKLRETVSKIDVCYQAMTGMSLRCLRDDEADVLREWRS